MSTSVPNGFTETSTPITSTYSGEVIQNLVMNVSGDTPAIHITSDNVTIKNVEIETTSGDGIDVSGNNASISQVEVDGPTPTNDSGHQGRLNYGVYAYNVSGLKVDSATFQNMGTGVETVHSSGSILSNIQGSNMQGPFPGGQLVQFNTSPNSSLNGFYVKNDASLSHPEDDISVYNSQNVRVSNGTVDGDNSPTGVGVMVEGASDGTTVNGVAAIHMGNGAFSSYSNNVSFNDVHAFSNVSSDQGRGSPASNALLFYAPGSNVSFTNATYTDPANPNNVVNGQPSQAQITDDANRKPPSTIDNTYPWDTTASAHTLILGLAESAYDGDAQYTVSVDGQQIGGTRTAQADQKAGQSQPISLTGAWGPGDHSVSVDFLNDAYGGTGNTDRNLFVDGASIDGTTVPNSNLILYTSGSQTIKFHTP